MNKRTLIALAAITVVAGCRKPALPDQTSSLKAKASDSISISPISGGDDSNFVLPSAAALIASRITKDAFLYGTPSTSTIRSIASSFTLPDKTGKTALYVFNYANDGGYTVLSADYRYQPICAFVERGSMTANEQVPSMLGCWYGNTIQCIEALRDNSYNNTYIGYNSWIDLANQIQIPRDPFPRFLQSNNPYMEEGGAGCNWTTPTITVKGGLLGTLWGQGKGYNDKCPDLGCNSSATGTHAYTGCVATSMAQLIKYWQPSNTVYRTYSYTSMPNQIWSNTPNSAGIEQVQYLMKDAGTSVNMNYGCESSGADGGFFNWLLDNSSVPSALETYWHLQHGGDVDDYNDPVNDRWMIVNDIEANRPVILSGFTSFTRFFGFEWGSGNGHMWICDGYRREHNACMDEIWLHMNWGWDGAFNDWYYQSNWNWVPASGSNYQYMNNIIHNIHN